MAAMVSMTLSGTIGAQENSSQSSAATAAKVAKVAIVATETIVAIETKVC